jgi:Mg/Co/Ni transporter MgtE
MVNFDIQLKGRNMDQIHYVLSPLGESLLWLVQKHKPQVKKIWETLVDAEDRETAIRALLKNHPDNILNNLKVDDLTKLTEELKFVRNS